MRNYAALERQVAPTKTFGGEGNEDGKLSRPWGICCDKIGRVIVADRSNNRIQIFSADGVFLLKFGTFGTRPGQLNRPAGVTVNALNQIIVADKDNHRIQVFGENGAFVFMFGSAGRQAGQFNYPWGVACNAKNEIAVSDTRNHRVQIFSMYGQFLRKCTFDAGLVGKNMYSPRGLAFLPDGCLVVTDFNGHRVAVLDMSNLVIEVAFYGAEGNQPGMFCRPQGVALDNAGNILVCDSRCNRIQVFSPSRMRVLAVLGIDHPYKVKAPPPPPSIMIPNDARSLSTYGQQNLQILQEEEEQQQPPQMMAQLIQTRQQSQQQQHHGPPTPPLESLESDRNSCDAAPASNGFLMDRPSDVCVGIDGRVYVVDFGNNCVHIF